MTADGLEHRHDIAIAGTRLDRTAVDEHGRPVQACHRHRAARHVLVAAADRDETVEAFRGDDRFNRIGDDLAGHQ